MERFVLLRAFRKIVAFSIHKNVSISKANFVTDLSRGIRSFIFR